MSNNAWLDRIHGKADPNAERKEWVKGLVPMTRAEYEAFIALMDNTPKWKESGRPSRAKRSADSLLDSSGAIEEVAKTGRLMTSLKWRGGFDYPHSQHSYVLKLVKTKRGVEAILSEDGDDFYTELVGDSGGNSKQRAINRVLEKINNSTGGVYEDEDDEDDEDDEEERMANGKRKHNGGTKYAAFFVEPARLTKFIRLGAKPKFATTLYSSREEAAKALKAEAARLAHRGALGAVHGYVVELRGGKVAACFELANSRMKNDGGAGDKWWAAHEIDTALADAEQRHGKAKDWLAELVANAAHRGKLSESSEKLLRAALAPKPASPAEREARKAETAKVEKALAEEITKSGGDLGEVVERLEEEIEAKGGAKAAPDALKKVLAKARRLEKNCPPCGTTPRKERKPKEKPAKVKKEKAPKPPRVKKEKAPKPPRVKKEKAPKPPKAPKGSKMNKDHKPETPAETPAPPGGSSAAKDYLAAIKAEFEKTLEQAAAAD